MHTHTENKHTQVLVDLEPCLQSIALPPWEAHPRLRHPELHLPPHLRDNHWHLLMRHCHDRSIDGNLDLHRAMLASLLGGDDGDVRANRVGRVEVGRQLQYSTS